MTTQSQRGEGAGFTCFAAVLPGQVRERRLGPAVAAQRVAVLGGDVRGQRGRRGQVAAVLPLHGLHAVLLPRQEGVAEQLAQQSILGEVVQELREVLRMKNKQTNQQTREFRQKHTRSVTTPPPGETKTTNQNPSHPLIICL